MTEDKRPLMVTIQCITYNQERYIRKCLDGFVMQKTTFRFEAIVHDDASTDSTADIVREYAEKYPDIIRPVIETENQHSKHDGSLGRIMESYTYGKYIAKCEGDDYWIDPLKLQKQVDFMEAHPQHSLCFCAHKELYPSGEMIDVLRYEKNQEVCPMHDIILGGGGFMMTNTMLYRRSMYVPHTTWAIDCPIGDAPMMLSLAHCGKVGYLADVMCVYRRMAVGSWSVRMATSRKFRKSHKRAIIKMWHQFDEWSGGRYHEDVMKRIRDLKKIHIIIKLKLLVKHITKTRNYEKDK